MRTPKHWAQTAEVLLYFKLGDKVNSYFRGRGCPVTTVTSDIRYFIEYMRLQATSLRLLVSNKIVSGFAGRCIQYLWSLQMLAVLLHKDNDFSNFMI